LHSLKNPIWGEAALPTPVFSPPINAGAEEGLAKIAGGYLTGKSHCPRISRQLPLLLIRHYYDGTH